MWRRCAVMLVVLTAPSLSWGQNKLENLLPANSQLYFRWDGVEAHKDAADKLAVMKMWNGETGDFLRGAWKYMEGIGKQALATEFNPELAGAVFDEFGGVLKSVGNKGFSLGVELQDITPFKMQATLVFPNGAGPTKTPLSFINTMTRLDKELQVKTAKQGQREIKFIHAEPIYLAWWAEGKDAVWSVGTTEPTVLLKGFEDGKDGVTANALYKQTQGFNEFPAWLRGYFDLPGLLRVTGKVHPAVGQISGSMGLDTIKGFTFYSGFDGPAERAVTMTHLTPGPRKGLLKLTSNKKFSIKDLPPMPHDLSGFAAATAEWGAGYEVAMDVGTTVINLIAPFGAPDIKQGVQNFEKNHNVSIIGLLNALDAMYVTYSASAEGPLGLGQTQLIKVKDEQRLTQELMNILKAVEKETMGVASVKSAKYKGATLHTLSVNEPGSGVSFSKLSFTIHKGWLAFSNYPQPIKGFILRSNGELPVWKANQELQAKLDAFPKEFSGIAVSDPRPTLKFILSILPPIIDLSQTAAEQQFGKLPGVKFDVNLIPNAYQATKDLFPNVTVSTVDGDTIRTETRSSLLLPF